MDYTLHQLRIFLKVTQTLNITRAAEELNLTQPAVSIQLKNFQRQFELPLIEIVNKKLYVTDFGLELAEVAEKILEEVYALNYKTLIYKGKLAGKLKISVASTGKYVMPYFLTDFLKLNPGIELSLDVTNRSKVIESLQQNEVDFSLVSVLPEHLRLNKIDLMQNRLFLIGNKDFLPKSNSSSPNLLEKIPLIFREEGSATRSAMEFFINKNQLKAENKFELSSNEAVKHALIAGLGCSIMPLIGLRNELRNNQLQIIPIDGLPITSTWNLVWLEQKRLNPLSKAFIEFITEHKESIIQKRFDWIDRI